MTRRTRRHAPVLGGTRAGKYGLAEASLAGETASGATNIAVAAACDAVALVIAGDAVPVKDGL